MILILLSLFLTVNSFAIRNNSDEQFLKANVQRNYITNSGAEFNDLGVTDSSSIHSRTTTTPIFGVGSHLIDGTANTEIVDFLGATFDAGIVGLTCNASFVYKGDASLYTYEVILNGSIMIGPITMTNSANSVLASSNFTCNSVTGPKVRIRPTAAGAAAFRIDSVFIGSGAGAAGIVVGPVSSTNNSFAVFDGTTGALLEDQTLLKSAGNNGITAIATSVDNSSMIDATITETNSTTDAAIMGLSFGGTPTGVGNTYGFLMTPPSSGTRTNFYGLYEVGPVSGTTTNAYGLYLNITGASTINRAIQVQNGDSYLRKVVIQTEHNLELRENQSNGTFAAKIKAPFNLDADYTLTLPVDDGNANEFLSTNGTGTLTWEPSSGANTALSNVAATAINNDLLPSIDDDGLNIGSNSFRWSNGYFAGSVGNSNASTTYSASVLELRANSNTVMGLFNAEESYIADSGGIIAFDAQSRLLKDSAANTSLTFSDTALITISKHIVTSGTTPTMGSCGTSPSIAGNDVNGRITVGTGGAATSCTITFATSWAITPVCSVGNETTALFAKSSPTTSTLVITSASAFNAADKLVYHCEGF